jgi:hypothetical protein
VAREEATRVDSLIRFLRFLFRLPLMLVAIAVAAMAAFLLAMTVFRIAVYLYDNFLKYPW